MASPSASKPRTGIPQRGAPGTPGTPGGAGFPSTPGSSIAASTPSPASRVRRPAVAPSTPSVPPRSAARESPTNTTPAKVASASGLPRSRKMSIPRLSSGSAGGSGSSASVPPLPTPRRPRKSGGLDKVKTPTTPARRLPEVLEPARRPADARENGENGHGTVPEPSPPAPDFSQPAPDFSPPVPDFSPPVPDFSQPREQPREQPQPSYELNSPTPREREDALAAAQQRAHDLEIQYRLLQAEHSRCNPRLERPMRALRSEGNSAGMEDKLVSLLLDRETLGTVVRSLPRDQRMGLLGVIAEACKPSDIQAQIEMLEKYKEMRTGVLARLDDDLCHRVLFFLTRQELLQLRLVSKRFDILATSPKVWKPLCRELETRWDGTIDLTNYHLGDDGDWLGLFKSLWQREKHWTNGEAQSLALLSGHKNYVTSLKLCGETLISASYDDTIRIWHLPYIISGSTAVPPPIVIPAKSVSSLDYYAPEGVMVTGSHDIGRASVWRQIDGEWKVERILSGHLHGTRAVAINAQWLVSVGSDKAIVVWDWRTGTKIVRFGQQTNVCVGMNLLDNFIISATVDGVIRTFSIAKREMLGQFKISDMAARHPEVADKLKEVGVGALGMLNWFTAEGRFLACATKDIVIRLAWDWADLEEQAELAEGIESPTKAVFEQTPMTPNVTRTRQSLGGRGSSSPRPSSPRSPRTPQAGPATPQRVASVGQVASKMTPVADSDDAPPTTTNTTAKFALGRWPNLVEVLDITGTERGAFEAGRVRIVTSRRLSSRAGAERRVLVGTEHLSADGSKANMVLVPLGGKWDTLGRQAGLQGPTKNPMSLALDHDKLVYGCTDGSIVVAGFVATQSQKKPQPRRSSPAK